MQDTPVVIGVGRLYPQRGWDMSRHSHEEGEHEMILVLRGVIETRFDDGVLVGRRGDVLWYPEGLAHEERALGSDLLETMFITWMPAAPCEVPGRHGHDEHGRIEMLFRWVAELAPPANDADRNMVNLLMKAILHEYHQLQRPAGDQMEALLRRFLHNHLTEALSLEDLADAVGMTKYHFARTFRELTGYPPMAYLRRMRVEAAAALLLNTPLPLKAIAPQVGFGDEYHLSRVFSREMGIAPSQYRASRKAAARPSRLEDDTI